MASYGASWQVASASSSTSLVGRFSFQTPRHCAAKGPSSLDRVFLPTTFPPPPFFPLPRPPSLFFFSPRQVPPLTLYCF